MSRRFISLLFLLAVVTFAKADIPPFDLNVTKEGGQIVKVKGGFLGLKTINEYYGFDLVDQYWGIGKNGRPICYVVCIGAGNARCQAEINGEKISLVLSKMDVDLDINEFNNTIRDFIDLSDSVITRDNLSYTKSKKISMPTKSGGRTILIFTAKYFFTSPDRGQISISVNCLK